MTASKSILLRVTPAEHAEITSRAAQSSQSLSRWLVSRALGDAPATWATTPMQWHSSKLSTLQDLRQILRRGPPGSPEPVSTVEVRPLTPAEQAVAAELDEALATTNPFDDMI